MWKMRLFGWLSNTVLLFARLNCKPTLNLTRYSHVHFKTKLRQLSLFLIEQTLTISSFKDFCNIVLKLKKGHYSLLSPFPVSLIGAKKEKWPWKNVLNSFFPVTYGYAKRALALMAKSFWFPTTIIVVHSASRGCTLGTTTTATLRSAYGGF